jgi:hypothetical protein
MVSLEFIIDIIPPVALWHDSVPNRNVYQEYFLGGKGGWCVGLKILPLYVPTVLKSGNLKLLEPSGPIQVCNGIASIHDISLINVDTEMTKWHCSGLVTFSKHFQTFIIYLKIHSLGTNQEDRRRSLN